MELFEAGDKYILQDGDASVWCDRKTGVIEARRGEELCNAWNPICLGTVFGLLGKIKILADSHHWLLLIGGRQLLESGHASSRVYKITKITVLPLSMGPSSVEIDISPCSKHQPGSKTTMLAAHAKKLQKFGWSLKAAVAENVTSKKVPKEVKMKAKLEKRVLEELCKMFNYSDNYYYSENFDLTNCLQRRHASSYDSSKPLWMRADDRFFWNRELLGDLINAKSELVHKWIVPCIQGYYECRPYRLSDVPADAAGCSLRCCLTLVSRRSRHRAGTRYRRRGVDDRGCCANYVETEQVLTFQDHSVSFVQVRGSVPVYWSQPGNNYRPIPVLERCDKDTARAFELHFGDQLANYKKVVVISLAEQTGREKIIADAYLQHILLYNCPSVSYVAFDFHEYCRGLMFGNINMLMDALTNVIKEQNYCWVDAQGMIAEQQGVFRVNCIDSLDRTNVTQTAIARTVLEIQIRKFGLLSPDNQLPNDMRRIFNDLWANNGDAISRQYAGTAALKGDFTRTGERKFSGLMRDGVKSANRYLMHLFRDIYRQAAIDVQVGNSIEDLVATVLAKGGLGADAGEEERAYLLEKASSTPALIEEARTMLIVEPELSMGGWALINHDEGEADQEEMDTILLLSQTSYYVVTYDENVENLTEYQQVLLKNLYHIELGPLSGKSRPLCVRFWYKLNNEPGYFHTFCAPTVTVFNNSVREMKTEEEFRELLKAIMTTIMVIADDAGGAVMLSENKLQSEQYKPAPKVSLLTKQEDQTSWSHASKLVAFSNAISSVKSRLFNFRPGRRDIASGSQPSQTPSASYSKGEDAVLTVLPELDKNRVKFALHNDEPSADAAPLTLAEALCDTAVVGLGNVLDGDSCATADSASSEELVLRSCGIVKLGRSNSQRESSELPSELLEQSNVLGQRNSLKRRTDRDLRLPEPLRSASASDLSPSGILKSDPLVPGKASEWNNAASGTGEAIGGGPGSLQGKEAAGSPHVTSGSELRACATEPRLTALINDRLLDDFEEVREIDGNTRKLFSSLMKSSFSDDAIVYDADEEDHAVIRDVDAVDQQPALMKKFKNRFSQVSEMIGGPAGSPAQRRRKQFLELRLLNNMLKSNMRFKNCKTRVMIL